MELLESDDPIKGQLLQKSAHHRQQLENDAHFISERTEKILTNAIIIGGALAATYFLVSSFSGSKKKKKSKTAKIKLVQEKADGSAIVSNETYTAEPEEPGVVAQIGTALATQATMFLLQLAKEKLTEFMEAQAGKTSKTNDSTQQS